MKLCELTNHETVIIETMYDAWMIDTTVDDDEYILTEQPSTNYIKVVFDETEEYGKQMNVSELMEEGGVDGSENDEILVYEGTVNGEWCRIYIPTYWD